MGWVGWVGWEGRETYVFWEALADKGADEAGLAYALVAQDEDANHVVVAHVSCGVVAWVGGVCLCGWVGLCQRG